MKLRTFTATDNYTAMKMVREALGDEAIILNSKKAAGGRGVTVTAALESAIVQPATAASAAVKKATTSKIPPRIVTSGQEASLSAIRKLLRFHNVPPELAERLETIGRHIELAMVEHQGGLEKALTQLLYNTFTFSPLNLSQENWRVMLVGAPGVGKTMATAKIATELVMREKPVVVITTDTTRAGGIEQLASLTTILNLDLEVAHSPEKLREIVQRAGSQARIIIDSAGVNPYKYDEMKALAGFANVQGIEPVLVASAGGDAAEAEETARAFALIGIRRLMITRVDACRRLGSILTTALTAGLELCNISATPKVAEPCQQVTAELLSHHLTRYQREA